jgi:hypothetical protein
MDGVMATVGVVDNPVCAAKALRGLEDIAMALAATPTERNRLRVYVFIAFLSRTTIKSSM